MKRKAVWISCILAALFCGCAANARVIMTLDQVGPNVVATASGTVDLIGLSGLLKRPKHRCWDRAVLSVVAGGNGLG
jgi:hypothetical protein